MEYLWVDDDLSIPLAEIDIKAVRAQGAGGQNVNKLATAIHLRFDIASSTTLPADLRERLLQSDDQRISTDGVLVIKAQRERSQERNRQAALQRLADLLRSLRKPSKPRIRTRPGRAAVEKRLQEKSRRSAVKQSRRRISED